MLIIGIIIGFATLAIGPGGRDQQVENQARRIAALIDLAGDQAVMRSEELAVQFDETSYRFMRLSEVSALDPDVEIDPFVATNPAPAQPVQKWLPIEDDTILRHRVLPEGLSLVLELEDLKLDMKVEEDDEENEKPMIFLLSSGEMTPFELIVAAEESELRYIIKGGVLGDLALEAGRD